MIEARVGRRWDLTDEGMESARCCGKDWRGVLTEAVVLMFRLRGEVEVLVVVGVVAGIGGPRERRLRSFMGEVRRWLFANLRSAKR